MPLIITEPIKIGEEKRQPGYVLTEEDMVGRNIGALKRRGIVKWVDDAPAAPRSKSRRAAAEADGE